MMMSTVAAVALCLLMYGVSISEAINFDTTLLANKIPSGTFAKLQISKFTTNGGSNNVLRSDPPMCMSPNNDLPPKLSLIPCQDSYAFQFIKTSTASSNKQFRITYAPQFSNNSLWNLYVSACTGVVPQPCNSNPRVILSQTDITWMIDNYGNPSSGNLLQMKLFGDYEINDITSNEIKVGPGSTNVNDVLSWGLLKCPSKSNGFVDSRYCVCNAGYAGSISSSIEPPYYDSSTCIAQACPHHSSGADLGTGCVCAAGFGGAVIATTSAPFYTYTCIGSSCPTGSHGVFSGCKCNDGWSGSVITNYSTGVHTSTCLVQACPLNSVGTNVAVGCLCHFGFTGVITATDVAPFFYNYSCIGTTGVGSGTSISPVRQDQSVCPVNSYPTPSGCACNPGFTNTITTNTLAGHLGIHAGECVPLSCPFLTYGKDCSTVKCTTNSNQLVVGTPSVSNCACITGMSGTVTAIDVAPYYIYACQGDGCPPRSHPTPTGCQCDNDGVGNINLVNGVHFGTCADPSATANYDSFITTATAGLATNFESFVYNEGFEPLNLLKVQKDTKTLGLNVAIDALNVNGANAVVTSGGETTYIAACCFTEDDGITILSGYAELYASGTAIFWEESDLLFQGGQAQSMTFHSNNADSCCFAPNGKTVIRTTKNGISRIYTGADGQGLQTQADGHSTNVHNKCCADF